MELITEQWLNRVSRMTYQKLTSFQSSIGAQYIQFHMEFKKHANVCGSFHFHSGSSSTVIFYFSKYCFYCH